MSSSTTKNIILNGYFIPKDTCVFINQYQVNHDSWVFWHSCQNHHFIGYLPFFLAIILDFMCISLFFPSDLWGDPGEFRPDRFLGPSGLLNKELTEKVLIFGMGKRRCLGDRIARLEMFIFLTTLLHGRRIKNVPEQELDLSTDFGLTMKPRPYRITMSSRF